jgi:hypothetical protein
MQEQGKGAGEKGEEGFEKGYIYVQEKTVLKEE